MPRSKSVEFATITSSRFLHPLVGKDLSYRVNVLMIEDPKAKRRAVAVPPPPAAALGIDDLKEA